MGCLSVGAPRPLALFPSPGGAVWGQRSCPAGRAASCALGHLCHRAMAQLSRRRRRRAPRWQPAASVGIEYTALCSGLGSPGRDSIQNGAAWSPWVPKTCFFPLLLHRILGSYWSKGQICYTAKAVQQIRLWKITVSQVVLESTTHSACTSCLHSSTCPAGTVRHHTNEPETGLGHKEDKRPKDVWAS